MTIVEFFDENAVENVVSALLCAPDRVVLVGSSPKQMQKVKARYEQIKSIKTTFIPKSINRNNLMTIVEALEDVVEKYGECAFDLTGGEDLYLVAVGMVYCKYPDKVQLHRFNIKAGTVYDCDADGEILDTKPATLSVEDTILAYGGCVVYDDQKAGTTYRWNFSDDFCADVKKMWDICKQDVCRWNDNIHTLCEYHKYIQVDKTSLSMSIDKTPARRILSSKGCDATFDGGFLQSLQRQGLLCNLAFAGDNIQFSFKNDQVKQVLINAGRALELYVAVMARETKDDNGAPLFDDVMTGVTIDWDGTVSQSQNDVNNEIDVILIKGLVPVFISCKNGHRFDADELYKLSTVSKKFGGQYAKKVLVATQINEMNNGVSLTTRATAMGVYVVKDLDGLQTEQQVYDIIKKWV